MNLKECSDSDQKLTIMRISQALNVSPQTINNWYKWYRNPAYSKPENLPKLPAYEQRGHGVRYWSANDIEMLEKFKEFIKHGRGGFMSEYSRTKWGKRGKNKA